MVAEFLQVGAVLAEHKKDILDYFGKFINRLRHGNVMVCVFGPGGSGKTTLGMFLGGKLDLVGADPEYKTSLVVEQFGLPENLWGTVIVPPGQLPQHRGDWNTLFQQIGKGKTKVIINVVSAGFHSLGELAYESVTEVYQPGMDEVAFLKAYAAHRRTRELEVLKYLEPYLRAAEGKVRLITALVKQDLWWKHRDSVLSHYQTGEYQATLKGIQQERGNQHFEHHYLPISLMRTNFEDGKGRVLAETSSGYDDRVKAESMARFLSTAAALARQDD